MPHASRLGLPAEDAAQIPSHDARNAPFGSEPAVGNEHLSSVRETYLQKLAAKTGLVYQHLDNATALNDALQQGVFAERTTRAADVRWIPALGAVAILVFLYGIMPRVTRWR